MSSRNTQKKNSPNTNNISTLQYIKNFLEYLQKISDEEIDDLYIIKTKKVNSINRCSYDCLQIRKTNLDIIKHELLKFTLLTNQELIIEINANKSPKDFLIEYFSIFVNGSILNNLNTNSNTNSNTNLKLKMSQIIKMPQFKLPFGYNKNDFKIFSEMFIKLITNFDSISPKTKKSRFPFLKKIRNSFFFNNKKSQNQQNKQPKTQQNQQIGTKRNLRNLIISSPNVTKLGNFNFSRKNITNLLTNENINYLKKYISFLETFLTNNTKSFTQLTIISQKTNNLCDNNCLIKYIKKIIKILSSLFNQVLNYKDNSINTFIKNYFMNNPNFKPKLKYVFNIFNDEFNFFLNPKGNNLHENNQQSLQSPVNNLKVLTFSKRNQFQLSQGSNNPEFR